MRGAVGNRFWRALDQLLARTERVLATWCLLEMRVERDVLHRLFPPGTDRAGVAAPLDGAQIDQVVPDEAYREAWGQWAGREGDLYREAARLVAGLRWADVLPLDAEIRLYAAEVQGRYRTLLSRPLPPRVGLGSFRVLPGGTGRVRLVGYSGLHPLDVPAELMEALPYFDGRPLGQILRQLRAEKGLSLDRALVRKLLDFEILTASS
jgi:hypothetical protein